MLYLNPPFEVFDGVSLFADHADPRQHYYLPLTPRFTTRPDRSGREVPQIQVIRYAGSTGTGGFLNFDCDLAISQERLDRIRDHLRRSRGLGDDPLLSPPPIVDGSVRLMLFGKESAAPASNGPAPGVVPATDPSSPRFVRTINHAAKPSLYGDEQAAFSVALDQEGVEILDAALRGETSPIGVVYSLTYAALRPAYRVHVHADWSRVQEHLSEQMAVNSLVFSAQVDKLVDKLVEDRVIVIEADSFIAAGEGDDAALLGKDEALDELKEMVLNTFFEPSLQPIKDDVGSLADGAKRVTQLFATAGIGTLFGYRKTDITRIDQKSLNATFSERTAVLRSIYPQGHLAGLARAAETGLDPSRFTISVNVGHAFFKRRTVRVISRADWEADQIASVNVALTYDGDTQNVVLDPTTPESTVTWSSVLEDDRMVRDVELAYTVSFKPSVKGRPSSVRTPAPETVTGDAVEVYPRDLYEVMDVPINIVSFPWERYPSVQLDARYRDGAHGTDQSLHWTLDAQHDGQHAWSVFVADRSQREIEYSLVFHGADGRDLSGPAVKTTDGLIRVSDPFPRRLDLAVVAPSTLFEAVERAFVDVEYDDGDSVSKSASLEFSSEAPNPQTFSVELIDPSRREIGFTVTLVFRDGHVVHVPPSVTTEKRLLLRPDMKGRRAVSVRPEAVDFARHNVREVVVETLFEDTEAQPTLRFADRFTFQAPTDAGRFEFDYVDTARDAFRYRVIRKYLNGLSKPSAWQDSHAPELVVPVT